MTFLEVVFFWGSFLQILGAVLTGYLQIFGADLGWCLARENVWEMKKATGRRERKERGEGEADAGDYGFSSKVRRLEHGD